MKDYYPMHSWHSAGFSTPESTLASWAWARSRADKVAMLQCLTPEEQKNLQREFDLISEEELKAKADRFLTKTKGYRIVKRESVSPAEVILHVSETTDADQGESSKLVFKKSDVEWKMSQPKRD